MNLETTPKKQNPESPFPQDKTEEILDRHEVLITLNQAKERLKINYGIGEFGIDDELSTIEGVHLRHIVEQCMREKKKNYERMKGIRKQVYEQEKDKGVADPDFIAYRERVGSVQFDNVATEAAARWLFKLYDINVDDIPFCDLIKDNTSGKSYRYFYPPELSDRNVGVVTQSEAEASVKFREREEFLKNRKIELKKKIKELKKAGHKVTVEEKDILPEFKQHLAILREEARILKKNLKLSSD